MPERKRVFTPTKGYDIQLKIKDLDYTNDLRSVRIVSSIIVPYQAIFIELSLDPNDLILDEILQKEPLKLSIKLIGDVYDKIPKEDVTMELQYLKHDSTANPKEQITEGKTKDRSIIKIICVCRKPFKTMTSKVEETKTYFEKTPKEILTELFSKTDAELIYDSEDENTDKIDQVTLPPMNLYKTIGYLDQYFGLFKGASNSGFCQYDNKVYVQNLSARMKKSQSITIYQLASDNPKNPEIIKKCNDGKRFYTYGSLENKYSGSSKVASLGKKVHYIVQPNNALSKTITLDVKDTCMNYGAIAKNGEVKFDLNLDDRERYIISHTGNNDSNVFAIASIAREIMELSKVTLVLEKNLQIMKLLKVGDIVKLVCGSLEYTPIGNKYILKSSDINFTRNTPEWVSSCVLQLVRTNQYI